MARVNDKQALAIHDAAAALELVVMKGDLSTLGPPERVAYYRAVCDSIGVNPLTRPFDYLSLNGKLVLYANRNCTDQLRATRNLSASVTSRERIEDVYVVTARISDPGGRTDESIGAVPIGSLKGAELANAMMKAETKAKRRATLSLVGLSILDETEVETIRDARRVSVAEAESEDGTYREPVDEGRAPEGSPSPEHTEEWREWEDTLMDESDRQGRTWKHTKEIICRKVNKEWSDLSIDELKTELAQLKASALKPGKAAAS